MKVQFPETLGFFRLGHSYESFDNDAKVTGARNTVLTARVMSTGQYVPLAGVSFLLHQRFVFGQEVARS